MYPSFEIRLSNHTAAHAQYSSKGSINPEKISDSFRINLPHLRKLHHFKLAITSIAVPGLQFSIHVFSEHYYSVIASYVDEASDIIITIHLGSLFCFD